MSSIGEKISMLRSQQGLTQQELAAKVGYSHKGSINKIELGLNKVPQDKLELFATALDTTVAYLVGCEEPQPITKSEAELLEVLRRVPEDKRELVKQMALAFAEDQEPH